MLKATSESMECPYCADMLKVSVASIEAVSMHGDEAEALFTLSLDHSAALHIREHVDKGDQPRADINVEASL